MIINSSTFSISNKTNIVVDEIMLKDTLREVTAVVDNLCDKSIGICFTGNQEIALLNKKYFGSDKVTDILTFSNDSGLDGFMGEMVINIEYEDMTGKLFYENIVQLIVHGLLHLKGYDHINSNDGMFMREKEDKILNKIFASVEPKDNDKRRTKR